MMFGAEGRAEARVTVYETPDAGIAVTVGALSSAAPCYSFNLPHGMSLLEHPRRAEVIGEMVLAVLAASFVAVRR